MKMIFLILSMNIFFYIKKANPYNSKVGITFPKDSYNNFLVLDAFAEVNKNKTGRWIYSEDNNIYQTTIDNITLVIEDFNLVD